MEHGTDAVVQGVLDRVVAYLKARGPIAGLLLVLALVARCAQAPAPPERSIPGLAKMLSVASGSEVAPTDVVWEPQGGVLGELFSGRGVLFLGAAAAGKPRDVYRGWVRLSPEGHPIEVSRVRNLTDTEVGDDVALDVRGDQAVFATVAFGRIQGVSVLDLAGIRPDDKPEGLLDRVLLGVNSYQRTGTVLGVGRADILFDLPARRAKLTLAPPRLGVDFDHADRDVVYDVGERRVTGRDGGQAYAARAVPQRHHPKPFILWAVDTVRAEVGPKPIAWLEHKVFGLRDRLTRLRYSMSGASSSAQSQLRKEPAAEELDDQPEDTETDGAEDDDPGAALSAKGLPKLVATWPPKSVRSIWVETKPGEGEWSPVEHSWLAKVPHQARDASPGVPPPAYFYTTFIRPDKKRPYNEVFFIAMDTRRLELGMQAGFEDPKPLTGPPGSGRLPQDKPTQDRIVATFNGAFKTTHGKYGMMVDKRVLLPPIPGGATVTVTRDNRVGLGSWPKDIDVPHDVVSFRQNLDPLVEDGVANPTGRYVWGWQLAGTSIMTQRTAMCVTRAGHLYYAFAKEIDGPTLGKALKQAGCSYGMHLDMNPKHCGFVFTDIQNLAKKQYRLRKAHPEMAIKPEKFVRWSAKDFFYVKVRDLAPPVPAPAAATADKAPQLTWKPAEGVQPPPAWLPGSFAAKKSLGKLDVEVFSFAGDRISWRLRAGASELTLDSSGPKRLSLTGRDKSRVLAAIGIGNTNPASRYGMAFGGVKPAVPLNSRHASLVVDPKRGIRVLRPGDKERAEASEEIAQLPLLAEDGKLLPLARERGALRTRGALCVTRDKRVLVAQARHDSSDPLASVLLEAGCTRVVELERGSKHPSFVHQTGTATPPLEHYESSVLYLLGTRMRNYAFRWKAEGAGPSTKPSSYDYTGPRPGKK